MTTLRYKINGLNFKRNYDDDDDSWKSVCRVLTDAGVDVFVKLHGKPVEQRRAIATAEPVEPLEGSET